MGAPPPPMPGTECPKCGTAAVRGSQFCTACGAPLPNSPPATANPTWPTSAPAFAQGTPGQPRVLRYKVKPGELKYTYAASHQPVVRLKPGDILETNTVDCFGNAIKKPRDTLSMASGDNPLTGPFYYATQSRNARGHLYRDGQRDLRKHDSYIDNYLGGAVTARTLAKQTRQGAA